MRYLLIFVVLALVLHSSSSAENNTWVQTFVIKVSDFRGNSVNDAFIHCSFKEGAKSYLDTSLILSGSDSVSFTVEAIPLFGFCHTVFSYEAMKDGYDKETGEETNYYSPKNLSVDEPFVKHIRLKKDSDFFTEKFNDTFKDKKLKGKILKTILDLRVKSILNHSLLEYGSIEIKPFKANKYLSIGLSSTQVYNINKMTKYDVAKEMFEGPVRNILSPLNDSFSTDNSFFGFDICVIAGLKDFGEKYASADYTTYRFLIPRNELKKYKNKDISGQQLINKSVILVDDEKIDLTLQ